MHAFGQRDCSDKEYQGTFRKVPEEKPCSFSCQPKSTKPVNGNDRTNGNDDPVQCRIPSSGDGGRVAKLLHEFISSLGIPKTRSILRGTIFGIVSALGCWRNHPVNGFASRFSRISGRRRRSALRCAISGRKRKSRRSVWGSTPGSTGRISA